MCNLSYNNLEYIINYNPSDITDMNIEKHVYVILCMESNTNTITNCNHKFCYDCLYSYTI